MVYHMDIGLRAEQETMAQKPVFEPCCLPGVILSFVEHRRENYGMKLKGEKISALLTMVADIQDMSTPMASMDDGTGLVIHNLNRNTFLK